MSTRRRSSLAGLVSVVVAIALGVTTSCSSTRTSTGDPTVPASASTASPDGGSAATSTTREPETRPSSTAPTTNRARPSTTTTTSKRPAPTTTTTTPVRRADWGRFDEVLGGRIVGGGSRAMSVAVAVDGKVVHTAAFGERVPGEPARPRHRFRIASISKSFTATAVLRLVERDRLDLDEPVLARIADHLNATITDRRLELVTVRHLLGHASGIGNFEYEMFYGGAPTCQAAAAIALSESLVADPGRSYRYSNMNYCLLGVLLEAVTGSPYERVVRHHVLDPLGIDDMRTAGTRDVRDGDVLHEVAPDRRYMESVGAAGAWIATAKDVVRFADSLDTSKPGWHPLGDLTVSIMQRPSTPPAAGAAPRTTWYGLGLIMFDDGSFGHTGTLENTHAMVVVRPDGVSWAVLVSGENPWETTDLRTMVDKALFAAIARS